jgi:hypothetical protein
LRALSSPSGGEPAAIAGKSIDGVLFSDQ